MLAEKIRNDDEADDSSNFWSNNGGTIISVICVAFIGRFCLLPFSLCVCIISMPNSVLI